MGIVYYHHYQPKANSNILEINRTDDNFRPDNVKYDLDQIDFSVSCEPPGYNYTDSDYFADRIFLGTNDKVAFYVASVGYERSWLERIVQNKRMNRYIIHFVFAGSGYFNSKPVKCGQAFICLPNEKYSLINNPNDPMVLGWISVNGFDLENQLNILNLPKNTVINVKDMDKVEKLIRNTVYHQKLDCSPENMYNLLISRLFRVISLLDFDNVVKINDTSSQTKYIVIVKDYINSHYHQDLTVKGLAQHAGMSVSYLRQIFTSHLGMSPQEAIIQKRMCVAKNMLKDTSMSVAAIAHACGYSDQSAFCKVFRKTNEISPLQYRKRIRDDNQGNNK